MKVLVVDDKALLVKDIIRDIKKICSDAECTGFHKEMEALEFAKHNRIDIAVLDIDMPNMNGLTLAKKLRELNSRINIIFLTGFVEYAPDSYDVLASYFLKKPLDKAKLKTAFENLRFPVEDNENRQYDLSNLGARLKCRRNELGLTGEEIAELLDVSFQTVYRWESGERTPDASKLVKLANVLKISLDDLIGKG